MFAPVCINILIVVLVAALLVYGAWLIVVPVSKGIKWGARSLNEAGKELDKTFEELDESEKENK